MDSCSQILNKEERMFSFSKRWGMCGCVGVWVENNIHGAEIKCSKYDITIAVCARTRVLYHGPNKTY